ncbi:putative gpi anchored serine-threonine rich protein [Golovinomyces cichoracearum]|uniref:Putative gpi anchored serine-threonine rich protein n=1 Tax=Golovinomyces cichoracearum TaxID=62708 RepID=A0A420J0K6_9PEZI|nr:putative gpi anchored serine-threonine rich protein [Golovinomyces cichoracearum]
MHSSIISSISLLWIVAASLDTGSSNPPQLVSAIECAAQPVLELCLSSTSAIASACAPTDYSCLCQKYTDVLTCYNNCPDDVRRASTLSSQSAYCANASMYSSTQTSALPPASSSASATILTGTSTTSSSAPSAINSGSPTMTGTSSSMPGMTSSTAPTSTDPTGTHESSGNKIKSSSIWLIAASFALLA